MRMKQTMDMNLRVLRYFLTVAREQSFTKADLNWMDKKSRSSVEMSDKKFRPEMAGEDVDMGAYDEIILGFPIGCSKRCICKVFYRSELSCTGFKK